MYTRCPSCRAEISFDPPANAANLPDGYKHRIKCPSCGVTIGVKIPRISTVADVQPTFTPSNPNAYSSEPIYQAGPAAPVYQDTKAEAKAARKSRAEAREKVGRGKNFFMFALSVVLLAFAIVGFFVAEGKIKVEALSGMELFDGISPLKNIEGELGLKAVFESDIATGITMIIPTILLFLVAINAVVSLVAFITGRYSRAYNVLISFIIAAGAVCTMLWPYLNAIAIAASSDGLLEAGKIGDYFKAMIENKSYLAIVGAGIGVVQLILSLFFIHKKKLKVA